MPGPKPVTLLARWIAAERAAHGRSLVVGLCGAQGSGKSTLAEALRVRLARSHGLRAAVLALDDLYLTRRQRSALARRVHPLLATRGVPGTHDVALGRSLLRRLARLRAGQSLALPRFVKARDDRAPRSDWPGVTGPIDVVLFEGWCVGLPPQDDAALAAPVNALEAREDADGRWRRYANVQLRGPYATLFAAIDRLVFLRAPSLAAIRRWRAQQEIGNVRAAGVGARGMTATELDRFLQHYARLTRHALRVLPRRADVVIALRPDHSAAACRFRAALGE